MKAGFFFLTVIIGIASLIAVASASYDGIRIDKRSLMGYWNFDTDASDSSGNGHGGTFVGNNFPAQIVSGGKCGGGVQILRSESQYVDFGDFNQIDGLKKYTINLWMKGGGQDSQIAGRIGTGGLYIDHSNQIQTFFVNQSGGSGEVTGNLVDFNNWHMYTGIFNSTHVKLYVDGNEIGIAPLKGRLSNAGNFNFVVGSDFPHSSITGAIDEVSIYNRSMGKWDVWKLYKDYQVACP